MTPQEFLKSYAEQITLSCLETPIFPSVKIAQAALETGWGRTINKAGNNMYGIKVGIGWTGKVISLTTQEVLNGTRQSFSGTGKVYRSKSEALADGAHSQTLFRAYDTITDSIKDHLTFLQQNKRYAAVMTAKTPEEQAHALQAAGYATAQNYANTLISIINQNNLTAYDKKKRP